MMKDYKEFNLNLSIFRILAFSFASLFLLNGVSYSQDTGGEQSGNNSDVWALQVNSYSGMLDLSKSKAKKLTKAYISFRKEVRTGISDSDAVLSLETFSQNLGKILDNDQQAKALLVLGSLNSRWDTYVKILAGYGLSGEDMKSATSLVCTYMVNYLEARAEAEKSGSRFSSVTARTLKGDLDNGLSQILSGDQKSDWDTQTARKRRTN